MYLQIENIAKIAKADISIDGITVIAGANDTGKSTIGKALWTTFNSFSQPAKRISESKAASIERAIESAFFRSGGLRLYTDPIYAAAVDMISRASILVEDEKALRSAIEKCILSFDGRNTENVDEVVDGCIGRISEVLHTPDNAVFESMVNSSFNSEFNGQINTLGTDAEGRIRLTIGDSHVSVSVLENEVRIAEDDVVIQTEAFYLDDPCVVDELRMRPRDSEQRFSSHRQHLASSLGDGQRAQRLNAVDSVIAEQKLSMVFERLSNVVPGDIGKQGRGGRRFYSTRNSTEPLDLRNISTGMKTFAILKMLISNGAIEQNGTIILDEPEIHLHPEWQLLFAEIIVLLHKEFGMHVLLNTHSPYFLRAIEVYSRKHKIETLCKYYLATSYPASSEIRDVTGETDAIYKTLAWPLQKLEDDEYGID